MYCTCLKITYLDMILLSNLVFFQVCNCGISLRILRWLITTSCLISEFQISGRTSETFGRRFKLSAVDRDTRPRVWVWIYRLVLKPLAEVLKIRYLVQESWQMICGLFLKSRHKSSAGYQDPGPRVSDVRPDIWN